jgi:hypothetical protein
MIFHTSIRAVLQGVWLVCVGEGGVG